VQQRDPLVITPGAAAPAAASGRSVDEVEIAGAGQDRRGRRGRQAGAAAGHGRAPLVGVRAAHRPSPSRTGCRPRTARSPHHGRGPAALEGELEPTRGVRGRRGRGQGRHVFALTRGCTRSAGQVLDTPISETAVMGLGGRRAMAGMTPLVELMSWSSSASASTRYSTSGQAALMTGGKGAWPGDRTQFAAAAPPQPALPVPGALSHVPGLTW